jgi:transcriptional regulator with XRE-family HTH domain
MTHPGLGRFGSALRRLARHRHLDVDTLAEMAGVASAELTAVLGGDAPGDGLVRRLAGALRLHPADLFAVAELPVPEDLAPADPSAGWRLGRLVHHATMVSRPQRRSLRVAVAELPTAARIRPLREVPAYERYPPGAGGLLMQLMQNRNASLTTTAQSLLPATGQYLAASTYLKIGHGRIPLRPEWLTNFAVLIDMDSDDLTALTGLPVKRPPSSAPTDIADLIWDARRLGGTQLEQACALADRLRS